jgi:hypothetical protein
MRGLLFASALVFAPAAHAACGAAFCTLNTNWDAIGVWTEPGLRADLRFEYIDQDQPRAGRHKVGVGEIPRHHDEIETRNRNLLATIDYAFTPEWGVTATLPIVDREHRHIHNHRGEQLLEQWNFTRLGDVRLLGRYQRHSADADTVTMSTAGVNFGLKLPTGPFDVKNGDGDEAERSLQPGTGTTDLLLGAFYRRDLAANGWSWFIQGLWQHALNSRDDFEPGNRVALDWGLRYAASERWSLHLQVNAQHKERDRGSEAEPEDSGGQFVFLSPGASYALTRDVQLYGFVQLPIYQYVNGVQLTADWAFIAGLSSRF